MRATITHSTYEGVLEYTLWILLKLGTDIMDISSFMVESVSWEHICGAISRTMILDMPKSEVSTQLVTLAASLVSKLGSLRS